MVVAYLFVTGTDVYKRQMLSRVYLYMGGLPESPDEEYNRLAVAYADSTFSLVNDVVEVLRGEELKDLYDNPKTNKEILFAFFTGNFPSGVGLSLIHI